MDSRTAFMHAVLTGDTAQVAALLERDPALARASSPNGATALNMAAHCGYRDVAAALIAHGADVNAQTHMYPQRTPLLAAVIMNHVEVVELLLDHGADAELSNGMGWRPLHIAALGGQADVVRVLLAHGADAGAIDGARSTALALAARRGHAEVVEVLRRVGPIDPAPARSHGASRIRPSLALRPGEEQPDARIRHEVPGRP